MVKAVELKLDTLGLRQEGRVLTVTHSSPPVNLATFRFMHDLERLTWAVDRDETVGAVVLTGVDGRFISHVDPSDVQGALQLPAPPVARQIIYPFWLLVRGLLRIPGARALTQRFGGAGGRTMVWGHQWRTTIVRMSRSSTVYLAAINGSATGGGFEVSLACDIRYVSDAPHIRLGQVEILLAAIPGGGGAQLLPAMIGTARALEHMLDGTPVTADQAVAWGMATRVLPAADLLSLTQETAARLASRSPQAIGAIKQLTHASSSRTFSRGLDEAIAAFTALGTKRPMKNSVGALVDDIKNTGDTPLNTGAGPWIQGTRLNQIS